MALKRLATEFPWPLTKDRWMIIKATAIDVDYMGNHRGLTIQFLSENGDVLESVYDRHTFEEIELEAVDRLMEVKENPELDFSMMRRVDI